MKKLLKTASGRKKLYIGLGITWVAINVVSFLIMMTIYSCAGDFNCTSESLNTKVVVTNILKWLNFGVFGAVIVVLFFEIKDYRKKP